MKRQTYFWAMLLGSWLVLAGAGRAADNPALDFKEVYDLLRANLAGMNEAELDRAAVQGLIKQLNPRVRLIDDTTSGAGNDSPTVARTAVFDRAYGYMRVANFGADSGRQITAALLSFLSTNNLKGLVLDLRYASGQDYAAAAAVANLFVSGEKPLMDWGDGMKKTVAKTNAIRLPLALLVNRKTSGAAEAFAGALRQAEVGLLLGTNTAGQADMARDFPLKTGQRLRVSTTAIKMGNGQAFPPAGLKPDIQVEVSADDERAYFEDAFKALPRPDHVANGGVSATNTSVAATNRSLRPRVNEAELVRLSREGQTFPGDPTAVEPAVPARPGDATKPLVNDPALARALDLLKGLAVVQQFRAI